MLLAIDAGNTQTVLGLFDRSVLAAHWRIATNAERTADEHALLVAHLLELQGVDLDDVVDGIVIASSVPTLTATLRDMAERWFEVPSLVLEPGVVSGAAILADHPHEVGADRVANTVAAFERFGGPCVVVDFGTSTNFDVVSDRGDYLGGAIAPGIEIGMDALFSRAAALRRVDLVEPRSAIGRTTVECIQSGLLYGHAEMVDGLCRRFEAEVGPCTVVATGGLSGLIAPLSSAISHHEPWLTLHGLRLVFERNRPPA
ncbi:MAG: type III pantothenate kinase [Acidimicrobiales bacterium]